MLENPTPVLNVIFLLSGRLSGRFGLYFGGILASFLRFLSTPGASFGKRALRHEKSKKIHDVYIFVEAVFKLFFLSASLEDIIFPL